MVIHGYYYMLLLMVIMIWLIGIMVVNGYFMLIWEI